MKFLAIILSLFLASPAYAGVGASWSGANHLRRLSQVINTYPFIISVWANASTTTGALTITKVGLSGSLNWRGNVRRSSSNAQAVVFDGTNIPFAVSSNTITVSTWQHYYGEFVGTTSRAASLIGAGRGTNTGSATPSDSDSLHIGNDGDSSWDSSGGIAEVSLWNATGMSEANRISLRDKLAAGQNPRNITAEVGQPWSGLLVAYYPLTTNTDLNDATGNGHNLSAVGTISNFGSHPTIDAFSPGSARRRRRPVVFQ